MEQRRAWTLAACARILRPLVRLALETGIKHPELESLMKGLLLSEARRSWRARGVEPNISQLSVTTGINRKAVTFRTREPQNELPSTELSAAAKTFTQWLRLAADDAAHRSLPIAGDGTGLAFDEMARQATRGNVHHRTVLEELQRLNLVNVREGRVELNADGFVPVGDLQGMLSFLSDNARDHLLAGVANTLGGQAPLLERAVYAQGLSVEHCEQIHALVRQRWSTLQHELTQQMTHAVDEAGGAGKARLRVGIYTYFEETPDNEDADTNAQR